MKRSSIRPLSLLLASLILFASCSSNSAESPGETEAVSAPAAEEIPVEIETEPAYPPPDVSGLDYGGDSISFIAPEWGNISYQYTEELTGEAVNDAAYNRQVNVENTLNVKFDWNWSTDAECHNVVMRSVRAGDDAYQIVYTHCIYGISDYVTNGALYDLYDLPHTDFAAPWWSGSMMEEFRIGSKLYYAAGDLVLQTAICTLFNKSIAASYNMPDHYELVRNGEWTYDRFLENASSVTLDVNGDSVIDYRDQTGYTGDLTERSCDIIFFCGEHCTKATDEGLELVYWSDKVVEIFEKTYAYFMNPDLSNGYFRFYDTNQQPFSDGLALYTFSGVGGVAGLRDSDVDFGILPGPKYNEEQEHYVSNPWPCFVCVPVTITDPDKTGAVLELFCYESQAIQSAYNENLIRGKSTRDEESLEMLDIINEGLTCDIGGSYLGFDSSFHSIFYCFYELMPEHNENIASHYERVKKPVEKTLSRLYDKIIKAEKGN
jgi:ABC-type glycerol-3-phosphate transport system substrate-binding protein